jgi:hypothetical protein
MHTRSNTNSVSVMERRESTDRRETPAPWARQATMDRRGRRVRRVCVASPDCAGVRGFRENAASPAEWDPSVRAATTACSDLRDRREPPADAGRRARQDRRVRRVRRRLLPRPRARPARAAFAASTDSWATVVRRAWPDTPVPREMWVFRGQLAQLAARARRAFLDRWAYVATRDRAVWSVRPV